MNRVSDPTLNEHCKASRCFLSEGVLCYAFHISLSHAPLYYYILWRPQRVITCKTKSEIMDFSSLSLYLFLSLNILNISSQVLIFHLKHRGQYHNYIIVHIEEGTKDQASLHEYVLYYTIIRWNIVGLLQMIFCITSLGDFL